MPCRAKTKTRAKMIVTALPSICVVPCQQCRSSHAMPAVLCLTLKIPTSMPMCSVLCQLARCVSEHWGLGYGLIVQAKGFCCAIFKQALLPLRQPDQASPCRAAPCQPCAAALSACDVPAMPGRCAMLVLSVRWCSAAHAMPFWPCRAAHAVYLCRASGPVKILSVSAAVRCRVLSTLLI